ncbi:MAG: hypothetical protein GWP17_00530 [Aquificales bacterium]|nr:hypothetical protein [Aquificales bacterium]
MSSRPVPSAALVAANKRLHKLRAQTQSRSVKTVQPMMNSDLDSCGCLRVADLPAHLGWHSGAVTQVVHAQHLKASQNKLGEPISCETPSNFPQIFPKPTQKTPLNFTVDQSVKVYPDIALGMLRQEQAAAGRLWLLLRHLDGDGRGVLRVVNLRETLTQTKTPHRLCGWRQLRNLLRQGEGIFWQRDKERIWLRSAGRVAAALGVTRLNGRPVAVPVKHLLGSIGEARAYLYASFHAGRQSVSERRSGQKPIARDTLTELTGLTAESQRGYERRVGVRVSRNYVVGEGTSSKEERLWQQGRGAFEFVDHQGGQGRPGNSYIAWQLPNSYTVSLAHRPKGRQKRINRTLADLFMKGMTGNEQQSIEKRYFGDGAGAVKAVNKQSHARDEVYWLQNGTVNGRLRMWHVLSAHNG